jgi:hypothetical protein
VADAHDPQATVFPAPAGPDTTVTRWLAACSIRSISRRRRKVARLSRGIRSLSPRSSGPSAAAVLARRTAAGPLAVLVMNPPPGRQYARATEDHHYAG